MLFNSLSSSHVEAEHHDVAVLEHVVLALNVHLAGLFHCRLAAIGDVILIFDDFGTDKATLKVGVNHAGTLWSFAALAVSPGTHLLGTSGEEGLLTSALFSAIA